MTEVSLPMENHEKDQGLIERSPKGFVAVDIGALSPETEHNENSSSREGLQRNRETTEADGFREEEKEVTLVHVAQPGGSSEVFRVTTPRAGGKCRRSSRRRSTWLGPRKVLFAFAALSSMGTLILLYFTLSIAKSTADQMDNQ